MNKKQLREKYMKIRHALASRDEKSSIIVKKVLELDQYKKANIVMGFYPYLSEVDILPLLRQVTKDGKKLCLPKCEGDILQIREVHDLESLPIGKYGIKEPTGQVMVPDLVILPGVVFDRQGYRIGYGKGYYDRLEKTCTWIGVAFFEQCIEKITHDEYDKCVDYVITD